MYKLEVSRAALVTPPVSEPITLAEAKKQLELSSTDTAHDAHLSLLIQAAREQWEADTDSAALTQTWKITASDFYDDVMLLPKRPVQSITHVKYYDSGNVLQTLSTSIYDFDQPNRAVRLKNLEVWPSVYDRWDGVIITYVAGYTAAYNVPAIMKQAMLLLIGYYFDANRGENDRSNDQRAYESLVAKFMRSNYP